MGTIAWNEIPAPAGMEPKETFSADENSVVRAFEGVGEDDFEAYLAALKKAGFAPAFTDADCGNRYALLEGKTATVYLYFAKEAGVLRVYSEEKGAHPGPLPDPALAALPGADTFWQLPVDFKGTKQNGGMCYLFRAADGSFVILDGGYNTRVEAFKIGNFLLEHTPKGQKPVVSGWFFTHIHGDHFGAFCAFSKFFADQVEVKAIYRHFPTPLPDWMREYLESETRWPGVKIYDRLHTGTVCDFPGIRFRVLYTMEDLYPLRPESGNEQSMVLRWDSTVGQRVLFLADIEKNASACVERLQPVAAVRSDLVQFAHHGYEGASEALYDRIAAPTVLWPMNIDGYQENYGVPDPNNPGHSKRDENGNRIPWVPQPVFKIWHAKTVCGQNYHLANHYVCYEAPYVKKILDHTDPLEIRLPYTPTGSKLPDMDRIFAEKTGK